MDPTKPPNYSDLPNSDNLINPNSINPNSINPNSINPNSINPNSINPNSINPNSFNPNSFNPNSVNLNPINPNSINPVISCPRCRSIDIIKYSDTGFSCRTCGNEITLSNGQDISEVFKKLLENSKKPDREFITGSRVTEKFTVEEFKRATYEFLRDSERVPSYVFNELRCDNIMLNDIQLMTIEGKTDVSFTRTLGFNKEVQEYSLQLRYDSSGNSHYCNVPTTRTVIDWRQDNGVLLGEFKHTEINNNTTDYDGLANEIDFIDYSTMVPLTNYELDFFKINQNKVKIAKKKIVDELYKNHLSKAGDYSKNEQHDGIVEITNSSLTIVKVYSMVIHLRNLKAVFYSMASGRLNVYMTGEFPKEDDEKEFQRQLKILKIKHRIIKRILFVLAAISLIIADIICFFMIVIFGESKSQSPSFQTIVTMVLLLCLAITIIVTFFIFRKRSPIMINNIIKRRKEKILKIKSEAFNKFT